MIIFGIDPGVSGAISILENKKVIEVFDMPTMIDGKKNKKQVNGSQVTNIIKDNFYKVKTEIEKKIQDFISTGIEWFPINTIALDKEKTESVLNFLETLEDDDDVQHVYANLEINNNFSKEGLKT